MEARDALAPLAERPDRTALLFDVDGTLAPIVARPELATVPAETRAVLRRLSGRYCLVACVSGRAGADAERVVGVAGIQYVGNHGLELDGRAIEFADGLAAFRRAVARPVEDKVLSLSYHYRDTPDETEARAELERVAGQARAAGLVPTWGRKVLEVRPPVAADKGTAVQTLLERSRAERALYAGDDTTDLDAFAGLAGGDLEHAVRIAVVSPEGPERLRDAADLVVASPADLAALLRFL